MYHRHVWIKGTCIAVNRQCTFAETSTTLHENSTIIARLCIGRYLWKGKRKHWNVCWLNCDVILEATTSKPITALSTPLKAEGEKVRHVLMWEKDTCIWISVWHTFTPAADVQWSTSCSSEEGHHNNLCLEVCSNQTLEVCWMHKDNNGNSILLYNPNIFKLGTAAFWSEKPGCCETLYLLRR